VLKPGGKLLLVDGYRDSLWGWLIYDVCVAAVEGDVHHVSARGVGDLFDAAGFRAWTQTIHHRPAPFLLTEGVAGAARDEDEDPAAGEALALKSGAAVS